VTLFNFSVIVTYKTISRGSGIKSGISLEAKNVLSFSFNDPLGESDSKYSISSNWENADTTNCGAR